MSRIKRTPSPLPLPFSRSVQAGDFLFLSGQVPLDADGQVVRGDIATQTHAAMERIKETLRAAGASLDDVVRVNVWLTDMALFDDFNKAYASHFQHGFPARSTVEAGLGMGVDVEIEMQAWVGREKRGGGPMSEA